MPFFLIWLMLKAGAAEPVVSAWIRARPAGSAELRRVLPEVHEVVVSGDWVEVRSAGLSLYYLGPFQNPLSPDGGLREVRIRIPRRPAMAGDESQQRIGAGEMGVFLNGVPIYNRFAAASYLGRNMWHYDTVRSANTALGVLDGMIRNGAAHSPILGFALDGFPIYGPWGYAHADGSGGLRRMRSGYRLRAISGRTHWAGGTELTPSQYGPAVNAEFPLGTFAEDYEYRPDGGDLDSSNGRFGVTPEYPQGTYAYFLTTDDEDRLVFPYLLTERYRGQLPGVARWESRTGEVELQHGPIEAGKPVELRLAFPGARALEIVHEKPVHLMVVSSDRASFEHIHPQWQPGDWWAVTHTFARPGKYRLFAQFTRPGEAERLATFDVEVRGAGAGSTPARSEAALRAKLIAPGRVETGEDVTFRVELSGAAIEPYLGAWGHFVLLDRNLENFIHAHPAESAGGAGPHVHGVSDAIGRAPSSVTFTTNFARPGQYRLWAQFQVAGEPVVFPFDVEVTGAVSQTHTAAAIPAGAIRVLVDERGFTPARIAAPAGQPVTLAITRAATPNCGSRIVFPSLGIARDLPVGETTLIELPKIEGDVAFACGMGMFHGMIVGVTEGRKKVSPPRR